MSAPDDRGPKPGATQLYGRPPQWSPPWPARGEHPGTLAGETVVAPGGTFVAPDGTFVAPDGTSVAPDGTVIAPDGTFVAPSARQGDTLDRGAPPSALPTMAADADASSPRNQGTLYLQYADDVLITSTRVAIRPDDLGDAAPVRLPYASRDVLKRVGSYDVLAELGRGAMGVVYKAFSLRLCRFCALKVMIAGPHATPAQLVRFQNEAMLAARLGHPNIVSIWDAGEDDGQFYFVMAFIEGRPLGAFISDPNLTTKAIAQMFAKCARALHYAHEHGIVHRDIKPDNVIVDARGEPHITDFGIAANVRTDRRLTNEGAMMGTPAYMSPEQINGELAHIGPTSDVYSLGATLYHVLTGREVFRGDTILSLLAATLREEPVPPRIAAAKHSKRVIPLDLDTICLKALEKQSHRRYPTALALAEDLEAYVEDRPVSARPISRVERLQKLLRRNRAFFALGTIVASTLLVLGLAFGVVTVFNIQRTSATIRAQDEQAGMEQAATLERAIRVNMLQGRADVVRTLVNKLREDPAIASIDVVRTDRTLAYTDLSTRRQVERRLADPEVLARIEREKPEFLDEIAEVKRLAFANIDRQRQPVVGLFEYDRGAWAELVDAAKPKTERTEIDGEPFLTVFKPIENNEDCQVCHGAPGEGSYGKNQVRAVLVVRRSLAAIERRIEENRRMTLAVGGATAAAILLLLWFSALAFGLRFRRPRYGA